MTRWQGDKDNDSDVMSWYHGETRSDEAGWMQERQREK